MRTIAALLFAAALAACSNAAERKQEASWDYADPCVRADVLNGGDGSLCNW